MRITPLDIRKQEFRKTMRGLDADEVYAFLTTVAEEYEAVLSNNKNLRERMVDLEGRLQEYKKIETNLRNTLLTAERVTNETKENARREASLIVREAEVEAEKAAEAIRAHTQELRREVLELKRQKDNYLTRFKTLLESHHRVLDGFQEDFANIDKEIEEIGQQVEEDLNKGVPTPRISRQKITEEFGHAPKDKVTWGDEPRREETPRPAMPKPGAESRPAPEKETFPSGDEENGSPDDGLQQVSDAQTSLLADQEEGYGPKNSDAGPVGAMGALAGATPPKPMPDPMTKQAARPPETIGPQHAERNSEEVRRSVARSIEEQLYPEAGRERVGTSAQEGAVEGTDDMPPGQELSAPTVDKQDDWKQYDVEDKKTDWKGYDIEGGEAPRAAAREWSPQQPAVERQPAQETRKPHGRKRSARQPDDSEVEEALSGLKEVSEHLDEGPSADEVVTLGEEAEVEDREPRQEEKSTEPKRMAQPSGGPPKRDETEWSMEELRKNLSSLNRDEGN
jgi:cell division initiation protein